jgi:ABC-type sulfate/molybdate transport systems ATPase subunit
VLEVDVEVDRPSFIVRACLQVAPGERLALFGPSGAGKTTLLEVIAGLVRPSRARITLGEVVLTSTESPVVALPPWQRGVGLLRQDPGLFPHLSVRDNLRYARSAAVAVGSGGDGRAEMVGLALALGIDELLGSMPAKLSGGQAHRVALGRLLLSRCGALLLDEPYTGLDLSLRRTLADLVISQVERRGVPAILVAHELPEAQAFAHRLAVLDQGGLLQIGAPDEVVQRPASRRVAELVGYTAFVPLSAANAAGSAGTEPDGSVAGIHPDRIVGWRHDDKGLVLSGVVTACRPTGVLWEIGVRIADVVVTVRLPDPAPVGAELVVTATDPPCFGPDGAAVSEHTWARQ